MKRFGRQLPSDNAVEAQAAAWLAQRDDGLAPDEEAAFIRWRDADPRHAAAVTRLEEIWRALRQLRDFRPAARVHPDRDLLVARPRPALLYPALALALAAVLLLAFIVRDAGFGLPTPLLGATKVYSTTTGGYQRLTLADGSVVELNEGSEVRVRYTAAERRVHLVRGEAHFTVAKNKARPFFVETPAVAVRAVGTAFDVRLDATQVAVLVTEGRVQLERHNVSAADFRSGGAASPAPPVLSAGWRAIVPNRADASLVVEQLPPPQARAILSWQSPRLFFVETPLAEVIEQFNRHNRVQLSLADPDLAGLPVGGRFGAENVEAFVRLLTSNGDIVVERPAPDRIVLHRAR